MEKRNKNMNAGVMMHEGYEAKVGLEALARAGRTPQLKGIVHEVMFKDGYNANPVHILQGESAQMTKSATAQMKDIIFMKNGHVHGSAQLKDTISSAGVQKTIEQIKAGHYNKTAVYGTKETAAKVAGKVSQKVHSSGISSETTSRIADKALGNMPGMSALGAAARSGGVMGAAFGAGIEAISSGIDVVNGEKDLSDAAVDVAAAGIKGGVTGAPAAMAGSAAAGAAGAAVTALTGGAALTGAAAVAVTAAPIVVGLGAACLVGSVVSDIWDSIFD